MKNVVLLAINAKYVHSSLAVWILSTAVKKYAQFSHNVNIIESTIRQQISEIADKVTASEPDIVGISTYIWNAGMLPGLLVRIRELLPDVFIVLGGPEASYNADYWIEQGADKVLKGEGEHSLPALLDELSVQKSNCETQNCDVSKPRSYRDTGDVSDTICPQQLADRSTPIDPYTEEYFKALNGRLAYIETSRGCPYNCAFCLSADSDVCFFPIEAAKTQLLKLSKSGAHTIKLVDRTFNCNADRAYELFEYIIGLDSTCCFHFEVAADLFDERTLTLLQSAPPGRIQLEAGLQSFYEPALKAATRQTDLQKAENNIRKLLENGNIHMHVDLIAGLPHETLTDFMESFDRAFSLRAHTLQLGFLKLIHGSELRKQADSLGINYASEPPYQIQSSPWLSSRDILTLKQTENALQHTCNKGRFLTTLEYVLQNAAMRPFMFFKELGKAAENHGTDLADYAAQIYEFCKKLPKIEEIKLVDCMVVDWLAMVKGKNMPSFMRTSDSRKKEVLEIAKRRLAHEIRRDEATILQNGQGIYVDSQNRNPVTGLYKVVSVCI